MQLKCPQCGHSRDIPDEAVPDDRRMATCPKCRYKFDFRRQGGDDPATETGAWPREPSAEDGDIWDSLESMDREPEAGPASAASGDFSQIPSQDPGQAPGEGEQDPPEDEPRIEAPFERLDRHGFFGGLLRTIQRVMLHPGLFFFALPPDQGRGRPLIFYVLVSEFQALAGMVWATAGMPFLGHLGYSMSPQGSGPASLSLSYLLTALVLFPLFLIPMLYLVSLVHHFFLYLFRAGDAGFTATFRVAAYANAPAVLGAVPFVGALAGAVWGVVVMVIGYKNIHRSSYAKVILALIASFMAVVALFIILSLVLFSPGGRTV